jgi:hypothetical protein
MLEQKCKFVCANCGRKGEETIAPTTLSSELTSDPQVIQRLVTDELSAMQPEVLSALYPFAQLVAKYGEVITAGDAASDLAESLCRSIRQKLVHALKIHGAKLPEEIANQLPGLSVDLACILLTQAFNDADAKPASPHVN